MLKQQHFCWHVFLINFMLTLFGIYGDFWILTPILKLFYEFEQLHICSIWVYNHAPGFCNRSSRNMSFTTVTFQGIIQSDIAESPLLAADADNRSSVWLVPHCTAWWRDALFCLESVADLPSCCSPGIFFKHSQTQWKACQQFSPSCIRTQLGH